MQVWVLRVLRIVCLALGAKVMFLVHEQYVQEKALPIEQEVEDVWEFFELLAVPENDTQDIQQQDLSDSVIEDQPREDVVQNTSKKQIVKQLIDTIDEQSSEAQDESQPTNSALPKVPVIQEETFDEIDSELPETHLLDLPFFSQAPDGNRNQPWQDACEEASIILPAFWLKWVPLDAERLRSEILNLVALQQKIFWSYIDTSIAQTQQMHELYYDIWTTKILDDPSIQQLKEELARGHPIVAPFAGKMLGNMYYSNGWPRYHMLVIVWYDETWFITHDVGTKRGSNYRYDQHVLMDALHDLIPPSQWPMSAWKKRVLIMMPQK